METIIIQAKSKKAKALKQFLKAFDIEFKVKVEEDESPYNPEFVKKILERAKSAREGNTVAYDEKLREELFGE
jgi:hypothetical protein